MSDLARAAEDRFHRDLIPVLRRRGWRPRIIPYDGYGLAAPAARPVSGMDEPRSMVRVMARIVMRPPHAPAEGPLFRHLPDRPVRNAEQAREIAVETWLDAQRGWRHFMDVPVPYLPLTVQVGGKVVRTRADRSGYVDLVVRDHDLAPGWHEALAGCAATGQVACRVQVIAPGPRLGVVCDIDDTVMVTGLPRALIAGWNVLVKSAAAREVVPGMPQLLERILTAHPGSPLVYLSTGAWNVVPTVRSFFSRTGLPLAPMLMTDWGPTNTGWFRSGPDHKRTALRRLLIDLPQVRWLLIGDDGQHDPLIYSEVVREHADRVAAVAIRRLSGREQVLAGTPLLRPLTVPEAMPMCAVPRMGGAASRVAEGIGPLSRALAESDVPVVTGRDGFALARHLPDTVLPASPGPR